MELKARNWQDQVGQLSDVGKLVHLAMRMTEDDSLRIAGELTNRRRMVYEDELTAQAARVGCPGRRGRLTTGPSLTAIRDQSKEDGSSIVGTYNYDLALAIEAIRIETPTANRNTYAKRLQVWDAKRTAWKMEQIAQYTEGTARALAQQNFYQFNDLTGFAILLPEDAVCPVCIGWIQRGEVPLNEAERHPPPYHVNCPHNWRTYPGRIPPRECPNLWMGE